MVALVEGEKFGIWGGLSEQRRRLYRRGSALADLLAAHPFVVSTLKHRVAPEGWRDVPRLVLTLVAPRRATVSTGPLHASSAFPAPRVRRVIPPMTTREVMAKLHVSQSAVVYLEQVGHISRVGTRPQRGRPATTLYDPKSVAKYAVTRRRPGKVNAEQAAQLRDQGWTLRAIAAKLSASHTEVRRVLLRAAS
jgi:hypothetical protein